MSTLLEAGSELAGYRVERVLGQGDRGVVYLARDLRVERPDGRATDAASMSHRGGPDDSGYESIAVSGAAVWSLATDGTVSKFDAQHGGVTDIGHLGSGAWGPLAAGPDGVWVGDTQSGTITRVPSRHISIALGGAPNAIRVDGGRVYVATSPLAPVIVPKIAPRAAGTIRIVGDFDNDFWDGTSYLGGVAWPLEAITCNALLDYRSTSDVQHQGDLVPGIAAAAPTVSPDGRRYAFTIRKGLRFSDGTALGPDDVVDTYLRNLSPKAGFDASKLGYFDGIAGAPAYEHGTARTIAGIGRDGDRVQFLLTRPDPTFPLKTAMRIMCIVPRGTPRAHQQVPPPTTAPFVIVSHDQGRSLVATANPAWPANQRLLREPSPRGVTRIEVTFGLTAAAQVAAIEAGRAELSFEDPLTVATAPQLRADPHLVTAPVGSTQYLALDTRRGPFRNPLLRRAANLAIDRSRLAAAPVIAPSQPWSQYLPSTLAVSGLRLPYPLRADAADARRLVRQSGLRRPIPVSLWYLSGRPQVEAAVAEMKRDLDAVRFDVILRPMWSSSLHFGYAGHGRLQMDMAYAEWGEDFPDALTVLPPLLKTGAGTNYGYYSSRIADRAMARVARIRAAAARRTAWAQLAGDIARRDAPLVVLTNFVTNRLHSDRVHNVVISYGKTATDYALLQLDR